jgi:hypothetical protein
MSGSKLNLFFRKDKLIIAAGLFNEKVGTIEKPLLVAVIDPEKCVMAFVLSIFWAKDEQAASKSITITIFWFK